MCVQPVDAQCILQFTFRHAVCCGLHRPTSQVIPCQGLSRVLMHVSMSPHTWTSNHEVSISRVPHLRLCLERLRVHPRETAGFTPPAVPRRGPAADPRKLPPRSRRSAAGGRACLDRVTPPRQWAAPPFQTPEEPPFPFSRLLRSRRVNTGVVFFGPAPTPGQVSLSGQRPPITVSPQ